MVPTVNWNCNMLADSQLRRHLVYNLPVRQWVPSVDDQVTASAAWYQERARTVAVLRHQSQSTVQLQILQQCSPSADAGVHSDYILPERFCLDDFVAIRDTAHPHYTFIIRGYQRPLLKISHAVLELFTHLCFSSKLNSAKMSLPISLCVTCKIQNWL